MKTILLIDADGQAHDIFITTIKAKYTDLRPVATNDAITALRILDENPKDVEIVVMDMFIDGMDAFDLFERLLKEKTKILVTARSHMLQENRAKKIRQLGAVMIMNPYVPEKLFEEINKLRSNVTTGERPKMEQVEKGDMTPFVSATILAELAEQSGQNIKSVQDSFSMLKSFDEVAEACDKCGSMDVKAYVNKILTENYNA